MTEEINGGEKNNLSFSGKIAVITGADPGIEDFHSAKQLILKYGAEKVIHITWPENFTIRPDRMIGTISGLAADSQIKILIFNQALPGTNAMVDKFRETRDDVFIIYCTGQEPTLDIVKRADLILRPNELGMGEAMVKQAKKQGAKVFIHYSFSRHMSQPVLSSRRDIIRETCAAEGIDYEDAEVLDPMGEAGLEASRAFILEDVPKMTAKYGEDTAFFCSNCYLQGALIRAVVDCHAIYPQPCCPSPYHGFPEALGIEAGGGMSDLSYVISEACRIAAEKNMTDRLSTWPVSASMMFTSAGAEYAIKRISGEVPETGIDTMVLTECMHSYIKEIVGEESNVYMTSYSENGIAYENYKILLMSYLDF